MQLSVIIVNYNSRRFIEQCIASVKKSLHGIRGEIIVVDNNSTDGSPEYLSNRVSNIHLVLNKNNAGFAKACNQGFTASSGEYVLFLNPDTLVPETCLRDCMAFFQHHPDAGAVGVRMINANGKFLKESKRGFPGPSVSFYRLFGLARIFPRSKTFAKYYEGHLPERANSRVEILAGAFMMIRRDVFEKTKGFDEDFFMYGEDIDLSTRIREAGYQNYYLGEVSVIHVKGGSTVYNRKYVEDFYGAMQVFVKKYYGNKPAGYRLSLNMGIKFRKMIALAGLLFR